MCGVGGAKGGRLHHRFDVKVWFLFAAFLGDVDVAVLLKRQTPHMLCWVVRLDCSGDSGTRTGHQCVNVDSVSTGVH